MTSKKYFIILLFIILIVLLVSRIRYVSTNESRVIVDDKNSMERIDSLDVVVDSLKQKLIEDEVKIRNLDDSVSLQLFYKLVRGE